MDPVKNFAKVVVSQGYDDAATSIALSAGGGAELPSPASDGAFNLVWWNSSDYSDSADDPNKEIIRCTARSTDTLTVTRAQEGTSAVNHNTVGKTYKMILSVTKKTVDDIKTYADTKLANIVEDTTPQLGGDLDLQTYKIVGEGGSSGVYVDSAGDVGIGTTSPGAKLDVYSNVGGSTNSTPLKIRNRADGTNLYTGLDFITGEDSGTSAIRSVRTSSGFDYRTALTFLTNPTGATQTPVERMRIQHDGNVGIGTTDQFGGGAGVLGLHNAGTNPSGTLTNAIDLYASAGELWVLDAGGTTTQLSPHAEPPEDLVVSAKFPAVSHEKNIYVGVERWIARGKAFELVQELAKREGLLKPDEYIIKTVSLEPKSIVKAEKERKENWKKKWIEAHKTKIELSKEEAFEEYEAEENDKKTGEETEYALEGENVVEKKKPVFSKRKVTKKRLKKDVKLDSKTGKFYIEEKDESQTEIEAQKTDEWRLPNWIKQLSKGGKNGR